MYVLPENDLASHHTLGVSVHSKEIVVAETVEDLITLWCDSPYSDKHKLILGKGSNVLFTQNSDVTIVLNRIKGIMHRETKSHHYLHVGSGEDWPEFVSWAVDNDIAGLENLAMIPGCVGSSPIQNIGAYGLELKDVCDYVDALNIHTGEVERLNKEQCLFAYRNSIFKHQFVHSHIIVAVGIKLPKEWQPVLNYGPLQALASKDVTTKDIYKLVCEVRGEKLPDPNSVGNAGSFFKNPIVENTLLNKVLDTHPTAPHYFVTTTTSKLAAGWLIDQCGLKGYRVGGAQVHPNQALVLTNIDNASAEDILRLASEVTQRVEVVFGIQLEHEVRFYQGAREVSLAECTNV